MLEVNYIMEPDGLIMNSQREQLPVGLIAQLVEHCIGIAEVMGWIPLKPEFFFSL